MLSLILSVKCLRDPSSYSDLHSACVSCKKKRNTNNLCITVFACKPWMIHAKVSMRIVNALAKHLSFS